MMDVEKRDSISDQDLDWVIRLMHEKPSPEDHRHWWNEKRIRVMAIFITLKQKPPKLVPAAQKAKILRAVVPYLHDGFLPEEKFAASVVRMMGRR